MDTISRNALICGFAVGLLGLATVPSFAADVASSASQRIERHYRDLAEHNYNIALTVFVEAYRDSRNKCGNDEKRLYREYMGGNHNSEKPWRRLTGPRTDISDEKERLGNARLEEFGMRCLPNAYANYVKERDRAAEMQWRFNDELPDPFAIGESDPKWNSHTNLLRGLMEARTQSLRRRDELCHYYLMHKVGALSAADLAKIDSDTIAIWLYEENRGRVCFADGGVELRTSAMLDGEARAFAESRASRTYDIYKKCECERRETLRLLDELLADARIMDVTRFELPVVACREKIDFLVQTLNELGADVRTWMAGCDAAAVEEMDGKTGLKWKGFVELMPRYLKDRANGPMIAANSAMNKYYDCDVVREWHWYALGFQPAYHLYMNHSSVKRNGYDQRETFARMVADCEWSLLTIGEKLDQPTCISGMDDGLFSRLMFGHGLYYGWRYEAYCWKLGRNLSLSHLDDRYQTQFSGHVSGNGWISICPLAALGAEWWVDGRGAIAISGFSRRAPFVSRLNEIDEGKAKYTGLARAGRKANANGRVEDEGWLVVTAN